MPCTIAAPLCMPTLAMRGSDAIKGTGCGIFDPMCRALALFLIVATGLPFALTTLVLVRFQLDRERIISEHCVQRTLPEGEQTCHGQCHLKKQLCEQAPQAATPARPHIELRMEPAISSRSHVQVTMPASGSRWFGPEKSIGMAAGHRPIAEPVPWC